MITASVMKGLINVTEKTKINWITLPLQIKKKESDIIADDMFVD